MDINPIDKHLYEICELIVTQLSLKCHELDVQCKKASIVKSSTDPITSKQAIDRRGGKITLI